MWLLLGNYENIVVFLHGLPFFVNRVTLAYASVMSPFRLFLRRRLGFPDVAFLPSFGYTVSRLSFAGFRNGEQFKTNLNSARLWF